MLGNLFKSRASAPNQGREELSLSRHLETWCASRNFEEAIDLSLMRIEHLEQRHPGTHKDVIMATANAMRIAAIGGQASSLTNSQVARVEQASQNTHLKNSPETVFYATALVEYHAAFPTGNDRGKEFRSLLRLSEIADKVSLDPEIKKLSCVIRLESCFNFCHGQRTQRAVIDGIFNKAAQELSLESPSLSLYYQGFMKWKIGRYSEAHEILASALDRVDSDIAAKKDTEVTKTSLLEGQIRVSLSLGKLDEAEKQTFNVIARVRALRQSEEVVSRCKNLLVRIYTESGNDSLAQTVRDVITGDASL